MYIMHSTYPSNLFLFVSSCFYICLPNLTNDEDLSNNQCKPGGINRGEIGDATCFPLRHFALDDAWTPNVVAR